MNQNGIGCELVEQRCDRWHRATGERRQPLIPRHQREVGGCIELEACERLIEQVAMLRRGDQQRLEHASAAFELANDRRHLDNFRPGANHDDDLVRHRCVCY